MENPIKMIYRFNQQAGLLNKGYDDFLESSFQIEEALEGFDTENLYRVLLEAESRAANEIPERNTPKELARAIVNTTSWSISNISDVERLDKACDAIVYALGSIFKLGLDANQATRALNAVMKANMAKLAMPKDEHGKLMKPAGFVGPEEELQKLLDER